MFYKDKYLKYKNKYLTLKKQLGGDGHEGAASAASGGAGGAGGAGGDDADEELKAYIFSNGGYDYGPGECDWHTYFIIARSKARAFELLNEEYLDHTIVDDPTIDEIQELSNVIVKNDAVESIEYIA